MLQTGGGQGRRLLQARASSRLGRDRGKQGSAAAEGRGSSGEINHGRVGRGLQLGIGLDRNRRAPAKAPPATTPPAVDLSNFQVTQPQRRERAST